jgi:hypothetical protein
VAQNAYRGGVRPLLRTMAASLKEQRQALQALQALQQHRVGLRSTPKVVPI